MKKTLYKKRTQLWKHSQHPIKNLKNMIKEDNDIEQSELNKGQNAGTEKKDKNEKRKKPPRIEKDLTVVYDNFDAMRMLNISASTLYRLRKSGVIPFKKIGKRYYYPASYFENINSVDT